MRLIQTSGGLNLPIVRELWIDNSDGPPSLIGGRPYNRPAP